MIRKALRRADRKFAFFVVSALLFVAGFVGSTYAYFDGEVDQTATYAGGYVQAPSTPAATASGFNGVVTWVAPVPLTTTVTIPTYTAQTGTAPTTTVQTTIVQTVTTTPGVQGERLVLADNSTSTNCATANYNVTIGTLPKTQSTYTDTNRTQSSGNGDQF